MTDPIPIRETSTQDRAREERLDEIRREGERRGQLQVVGPPPAGAPFPQASPEHGYY